MDLRVAALAFFTACTPADSPSSKVKPIPPRKKKAKVGIQKVTPKSVEQKAAELFTSAHGLPIRDLHPPFNSSCQQTDPYGKLRVKPKRYRHGGKDCIPTNPGFSDDAWRLYAPLSGWACTGSNRPGNGITSHGGRGNFVITLSDSIDGISFGAVYAHMKNWETSKGNPFWEDHENVDYLKPTTENEFEFPGVKTYTAFNNIPSVNGPSLCARVNAGDELGVGGNTGRVISRKSYDDPTAGMHLHMDVFICVDDKSQLKELKHLRKPFRKWKSVNYMDKDAHCVYINPDFLVDTAEAIFYKSPSEEYKLADSDSSPLPTGGP